MIVKNKFEASELVYELVFYHLLLAIILLVAWAGVNHPNLWVKKVGNPSIILKINSLT
jgi:hypothetical protein